MKGSLFLSISVGCAALLAGVGALLVALAGVRTFDSMTEHYQTQSKIAKESHASSEDTRSLVMETVGFACAKVLGKFTIISTEDERQIAAAAGGWIPRHIQPDGPLPQPKATEISPRFASIQLAELPGPVHPRSSRLNSPGE